MLELKQQITIRKVKGGFTVWNNHADENEDWKYIAESERIFENVHCLLDFLTDELMSEDQKESIRNLQT